MRTKHRRADMGTWLVLMVLLISSTESLEKRCDIITTIDNGHFRNRGKIVVPGEKIISGSIIKLICFEGYELYNKTTSMYLDLEQTEIKCYQDSFTPETPSCVPKRCHVDRSLFLLPAVPYVEHEQTLNVNCPDNMELHLEGNYQKLEVTSVFCSKGIWTPTLPMCIKKMCQTIDVARDITGFIVSETKTTPGEFVPHNQSIEIVCGEGYRPHGIITCNAGIWMENSTCEPDVTGCVLKDRGMYFISLGDRTVLAVGENANVSCKFGYEIVPNISAKSSNENYYPDSESTADPSEMSTEDNKNLIAVSDGNYTCIDNGKWGPELRFSCKPISCPPPKQILNGRLIQEAYNGLLNIYQSTIRYDCDMGYRIVGPRFRKCQSDRTWSENDTKCEEIVCEKPSAPENGAVYLTDNSQKVGSQIEYICDENHTIEANASQVAICMENGQWSSPPPRCYNVTGCVLKDRGMYFISLGDRTVLKVGENANVSCKFGYQIMPKGSDEFYYPDPESTADPIEMPETEDNENLIAVSDGNYTCIDNGKWEPEIRFSCKQIMCESFDKYNLENGNIIYSTHAVDTVGTVVSFQCYPGYTRHGPETRTCQIDGTWSGQCVTCQRDRRNASITCPAPCVPEGARKTGSFTYQIGSRVKFYCTRSKTQDRDDTHNIRQCIKNGKHASWNGTKINCKEIICDKGDHYGFENGRVTYSSSVATVGTEASFVCNPGYNRHGPMTRICQKNGTWSGECVTCQKHQPNSSTCPAPCIPDGAIRIGSLSYEKGSIIQLYCVQSNMNYNVQNSYIIHCVNDGKSASWKGTNINCKAKCEPLTDTYKVVKTGVVPRILSDKTVVELNCNGSLPKVQAECRNGHWHPKKPTCKLADSCSLSAVEGTLYNYKETKDQVFQGLIKSGQQIKVTCKDGFLPNTQNYDVSRCVNGVWKPEIVKCEKTDNF